MQVFTTAEESGEILNVTVNVAEPVTNLIPRVTSKER